MARTTLDIDDDVMRAAREIAADGKQSIGAVISELARRGLTPARVDATGRFPVILSPPDAPAITPEMVRRALDED
ncbi:MAG: antitoxin [Thermoleophilia bacterium]